MRLTVKIPTFPSALKTFDKAMRQSCTDVFETIFKREKAVSGSIVTAGRGGRNRQMNPELFILAQGM